MKEQKIIKKPLINVEDYDCIFDIPNNRFQKNDIDYFREKLIGSIKVPTNYLKF